MNKDNIPHHIGIIMDGNGRWAISHGKKRSYGHQQGGKALKRICKHISKLNISYLSVFAFSTENFKRDKEEVDTLMRLFIEYFKKEFKFLMDDDIKVLFSGRRKPLPSNVLEAMDEIVARTKNNKGLVFNICLNYGGQTEIVDMVKEVSELIASNKIKVSDIDKDFVNAHLYHDLPPLDLVIRTSGEQRISNFMLWQSAYAEYYFPSKYFPDFTEKDFDEAIIAYQNRNRRFGGTKNEK